MPGLPTSGGAASDVAGTPSDAAGTPSDAATPSGGAGMSPVDGTGGTPTNGAFSVAPAALLWTAVRHHTGGTPGGRTNGPTQGPERKLSLHNASRAPLSLSASMSGPDAAYFKLSASQLNVMPGAEAELGIALTTDSAALGAAPAQDDGATVLNASLTLSDGEQTITVRHYALVLTYAELEPTFGQILRAFPDYTTKLPSWLPDDANPNPGKLPGIVSGTDEVAAPRFEPLDTSQPVTLRVLARFSPSGLVPFGWYESGKLAARTTTGTLAEQSDAQTNDKSRMLEPPLASGSATFTPPASAFGLWMAPAGVGLLTSEDASCFDGQHRVRSFALRDAGGALLPGEYLVAGEEANNGDYQDYVFLLSNVRPQP